MRSCGDPRGASSLQGDSKEGTKRAGARDDMQALYALRRCVACWSD
jgi:hypothetical protein